MQLTMVSADLLGKLGQVVIVTAMIEGVGSSIPAEDPVSPCPRAPGKQAFHLPPS